MNILCLENVLLEFEIDHSKINKTLEVIHRNYEVSELNWNDSMQLFDDVCFELFGDLSGE